MRLYNDYRVDVMMVDVQQYPKPITNPEQKYSSVLFINPLNFNVMVTITNYELKQSESGKIFFVLELQGDLEVKQSEKGSFYLTANKMNITTSFSEAVCKSILGRMLPGKIIKVPCEGYEYVDKETGQVKILNWKYQYFPDEPVQTVQSMQTVQNNPYNPYLGQYPFYNQVPQFPVQEAMPMELMNGFDSFTAEA